MNKALKEAERLRLAAGPLMRWFQGHARKLPWREDKDPYHVWVSEIMLQQTRVEAVRVYYERFLRELPSVEALAHCAEERLLKLWEGLGYYSRVRNMQKAARILVQDCGGGMPADYERIRSLPGIGPYTAGAVASIAFGIPVPAVDGNVLRVVSRICASRGDITEDAVRRQITEWISAVIPADRPGMFNQALMELGALVCVPNGAPDCAGCPVRGCCLAYIEELTDEIPVKKPRKPRRVEEKTVLVIRDPLRLVIAKRPGRGLLAGMYELPSMAGHRSVQEALSYVKDRGLSPLRIRSLPPAKHIFTHVEWDMTGYLVLAEDMEQIAAKEPGSAVQAGVWIAVEPERTQKELPVPSAFASYAQAMNIRQGYDKAVWEEALRDGCLPAAVKERER